MSHQYTTSNVVTAPHVERVLLPTQVIEKPVAVHEEIRKELIEEIQPVINVEKIKTEVHQVTQPLFDKEVRSVIIENRTLNTEVLPEVFVEGRGARAVGEVSTTHYTNTQTVVVEKPAQYNEVQRTQIIEEIQPVIYKETVVPTVIQETRPVYQKIVEGAVYSHETLSSRSIEQQSNIAPAYVTSNTVVAPVHERMMLPTQVIEKPVAVHEDIRRETIEEIQPIVNVEKIKTEVHQITAPLFDKEVRPVTVERRTLATEVLAEVHVEGQGIRSIDDVSSTRYLDTKATLIEKPAIYNEVERTQIIEEIQPVVYKETIVPTVIRETKPVYQKIVEGPVYTQQTLAPRSLHETNFAYPTSSSATTYVETAQVIPVGVSRETIMVNQSMNVNQSMPVHSVPMTHAPMAHAPMSHAPVAVALVEPHGRREIVEEVITTTTTTTAANISGQHAQGYNTQPAHGQTAQKEHHGIGALLHRHPKDAEHSGTHGSTHGTGLPTGHTHTERVGPNGQTIIEDTTVTHTQSVQPRH